VGELLAAMSSREFSYWMERDSIAPLGDHQADERAALICHTIAMSRGAVIPAESFMALLGHRPPIDQPAAAQESVAEKSMAVFGTIARRFNG
jgi:hypothetical protein